MDRYLRLRHFLIPAGLWGIITAVFLALPGTAAAPPGQSIDITSHGAVPDDGEDDTLAVLAALEACGTVEAATLSFPPGRYDFHEGANPRDGQFSGMHPPRSQGGSNSLCSMPVSQVAVLRLARINY